MNLLLLSQLAEIANDYLANEIFPVYLRSVYHKALIDKYIFLYNEQKSSSGDSELDEYLKQHLFLETDVAKIVDEPCLTSQEIDWIEQICKAKKELVASIQKKGQVASSGSRSSSKRRGSVVQASKRADPKLSLAVADSLMSQGKHQEALYVLEGAMVTVQEHMFGIGLQEILEIMSNAVALFMEEESRTIIPPHAPKPKSNVARRVSIGHKPGRLLGDQARARTSSLATDGPKVHNYTSARRSGKIHEKMTKAQISRNNETSDMLSKMVSSPAPGTPKKHTNRPSSSAATVLQPTAAASSPQPKIPGSQKDFLRKRSKSVLHGGGEDEVEVEPTDPSNDAEAPPPQPNKPKREHEVEGGERMVMMPETPTATTPPEEEMQTTTTVSLVEDAPLTVPERSQAGLYHVSFAEPVSMEESSSSPGVVQPVANNVLAPTTTTSGSVNEVHEDHLPPASSSCGELSTEDTASRGSSVRRPRLDTMMEMQDVVPAKEHRRKSDLRVSLGTMEQTMKILKEASGLTDAEIQWRLDTAKSNAYMLSTEKLEMEEAQYEKYLLRQAVLMKAKRYITDPSMERSLKKLLEVSPKIRTGREAPSVLGPAEKSLKTLQTCLENWNDEKKNNLKMVGGEEQLKMWITLIPTLLDPIVKTPYPKMSKLISKQMIEMAKETKRIDEALKVTNAKLDKCLAGMEMWQQRQKDAPESEGQLEKEETEWLAKNLEANEAALREMRSFIPINISSLSVGELKQISEDNGQLVTTDLAIRLKEKKLLSWVVTHSKIIQRSNFLSGQEANHFNSLQDYDIVELRAVCAVLPKRFDLDRDKKKSLWRSEFLKQLKALSAQQSGESVKSGWDPVKKCRAEVKLPPLTASQARHAAYFYPSKDDVKARIAKFESSASLLQKKYEDLQKLHKPMGEVGEATGSIAEAKSEYEAAAADARCDEH